MRKIIEGGPPEGILSRFNDMFKEKEEATHIRAAEVMRELGRDATDYGEMPQSISFRYTDAQSSVVKRLATKQRTD